MAKQEVVGRPLVAYINQDAFKSNIDVIQQQAPSAEMLLVVKADAYGHGVANLVEQCQPYRVAVASSDEALTLFSHGFKNEVVLLEGPFSRHCVLRTRHTSVTWVVNSLVQLNILIEAQYEGPIWLKFDTGMHRLGLLQHEIERVLDSLKAYSKIRLTGLMTHFSSADEPQSDKTSRQLQRFYALLEEFSLQHLPVSLCNSAGILFYPNAHGDVVRPGIALYGGWCAPNEPKAREGLKPVMTLQSKVIALRALKTGECVGYGEIWCADRPTRLATIAIGYGDGYPRHAPYGTPVWINGQFAPLAGRVSMDMITVDVTDLDEVHVGDVVQLWGPELPIENVAQHIGTISYELMTSLTARVPRVVQ